MTAFSGKRAVYACKPADFKERASKNGTAKYFPSEAYRRRRAAGLGRT
jgi:hypothetical protein